MRIRFEEKEHKYEREDGERYISVSSLVHMYEKQKNWDEICRKKAKAEGMTFQELKAKWENKRIKSSEAGTIFHLIREEELINQESPEFYGVKCGKKTCEFSEGLKYSIDIQKLSNNTVYPELMIYDHKYKVCGQSDKVIVTKNTIHVWDYKTDTEIKRSAFSSKWVEPEKLEYPLGHLDNCNFNQYSIKMSLYMFMLWKANPHLKVGDLVIEHVQLKRDADGIPILEDGKPIVLSITPIKVPYRKKEVQELLKHYASKTI